MPVSGPIHSLEDGVKDCADEAEDVAEELEHRADDTCDHDIPPHRLLVCALHSTRRRSFALSPSRRADRLAANTGAGDGTAFAEWKVASVTALGWRGGG